MKALLAALAALALLPSSALAGGFATVGLSSMPDGGQPGQPWNVELTILQHGFTPLDDLEPAITIHNGERTEVFPAEPVPGESGVYRAEVVFPTAGTWNFTVDDGFTQVHKYAPVEIGEASSTASAPAPADDSGGPWLLALLAALAAGAVVAFLSARALRRRPGADDRRAPAPAA